MLGCTNLVFRGIERYITSSSLFASAGDLLGLAPADVKANQWIYNKISKITVMIYRMSNDFFITPFQLSIWGIL